MMTTIKPGDTFSLRRTVTDELVRSFADLSGDHNPIHLDQDFAAATRFGRRIAHGMLSGAFISALLGDQFPERRIVYLSQTMRFVAPVYLGDTITTTGRVKSVRQDKGIVVLNTTCRNQDDVLTLDGEAAVMVLD